MVVGISRVTLALPGTASLKEKRAVIRRLLDRIRSRFHVSAAEVDAQDIHQRGVIGFATVGSDDRKVTRVLEKVALFVEDSGLAQVTSVESEVVGYFELGDQPDLLAEKFGVDEDGEVGGDEEGGKRVAFRPGSLGLGSGSRAEEEE